MVKPHTHVVRRLYCNNTVQRRMFRTYRLAQGLRSCRGNPLPGCGGGKVVGTVSREKSKPEVPTPRPTPKAVKKVEPKAERAPKAVQTPKVATKEEPKPEREVLSLMQVMKRLPKPVKPDTPKKVSKDHTLLEVITSIKKHGTPKSSPTCTKPKQADSTPIPPPLSDPVPTPMPTLVAVVPTPIPVVSTPVVPTPASAPVPALVQSPPPAPQNQELVRELDRVREEVKYYRKMFQEKSNSVIELRKEMGVLLEATGKSQLEMANLRIEAMQNSQKEKEERKEEMASFEEKVDALRTANAKMTSLKSIADRQIEELQQKLDKGTAGAVLQTAHQADAAKALVHAQDKLDKVRSEYATFKARTETRETQYNDETFKLKKTVTQLNEEKSQESFNLKNQLRKQQQVASEAKDETAKQRAKYVTLISRLKGLSHTTQEVQDELMRAEKQLGESGSPLPIVATPPPSPAQDSKVTEELAKTKESLKKLQDAHTGTLKELSSLKGQSAALQKESKYSEFKAESTQQRLDMIEKQLRETQAQLKLKPSMSADECDKMKSELVVLKGEVARQNEIIKKRQMSPPRNMSPPRTQSPMARGPVESRLTTENQDLRAKVRRLEAALQQLRDNAKTTSETLKQKQRELEEAQTVMRSGSPEMCTPGNVHERVVRQTQPQDEEVRSLKETVEALEAQVKALQKELDAKEVKSSQTKGHGQLSFSQTTEMTQALTQAPAGTQATVDKLMGELEQEKSDKEEAEKMLKDVVEDLKMKNAEFAALEKMSNERIKELADARVRLAASQNYERQLLCSISGMSQERRSMSASLAEPPSNEAHGKHDEPEPKIPRVSVGMHQTPFKTPNAVLFNTPAHPTPAGNMLVTPANHMATPHLPPPTGMRHALKPTDATPEYVSSGDTTSDEGSDSEGSSSSLKRKRSELESMRPSQGWGDTDVRKLHKLVKQKLPDCWTKESQDKLFEKAAHLIGREKGVVEKYIWANKDDICGKEAVTPRRPGTRLTQEEEQIIKKVLKVSADEDKIQNQAEEILGEIIGKSTKTSRELMRKFKRESS